MVYCTKVVAERAYHYSQGAGVCRKTGGRTESSKFERQNGIANITRESKDPSVW